MNEINDLKILYQIITDCEKVQGTVDLFNTLPDNPLNHQIFIDALSKEVEDIGELAKKLSPEFISKTSSDVDWKGLKGMRDRTIHNYGNLDEEILLYAATDEIPSMYEFLTTNVVLAESYEEDYDPDSSSGKSIDDDGIEM